MVLSPLLHSSNFILRFIWSHSIGHCCTLNCARCFSPVSIRGEDLSSSLPLQSHTYTHSHLDTARCKNNLPLFTSEQELGAGCQVQGNKEKWLLEAWRVLFPIWFRRFEHLSNSFFIAPPVVGRYLNFSLNEEKVQ